MPEAFISLEEVTRSYSRGGETVHALDRVDLEIPKATFTALMGPSGSGKSTMLNLLGGLDRANAGRVMVDGDDLSLLGNAELARYRADNVGFVFQGFNLLPVLTALQNVELPLLLAPLSRAERRKHALYALELVGLSDRVHHRPSQLSGGQEQRVAIARALATDPKLILADEPTGDLDRNTADAVLDLLVRLNEEFDKTIVMVTHDARAAERAQRTVHLDKGELERIEENRPAGKLSTEEKKPDGAKEDDGAKAEPATTAATDAGGED